MLSGVDWIDYGYSMETGRVEESVALLDVQRVFAAGGVNEIPYDSPELPLRAAAANGWLSVVRWLLLHGADPNIGCVGQKYTALHSAAYGGRVGCVRLLLAAGAHVDSVGIDGNTPFSVALGDEIGRVLLYYGAHPVPHHITRKFVHEKSWDRLCSCKRAARTLVGIRRFKRSALLCTGGMDVTQLLARAVWAQRMEWMLKE